MQALKNLDDAKGLWAEKLHETLWAYITNHKSSTGETPFDLAFGVKAVMRWDFSVFKLLIILKK